MNLDRIDEVFGMGWFVCLLWQIQCPEGWQRRVSLTVAGVCAGVMLGAWLVRP